MLTESTAEPQRSRLLPLKQGRSKATRARLSATAADLWRRQGFAGTTIVDICREAAVSRAGFYRHFARQEDILLEFAANGSQRLADEFASRAGTRQSTTTILSALLARLAADLRTVPRDIVEATIRELLTGWHPGGSRFIEVRGNRADITDVFTSLFERGQQRGEVSCEWRPSELALVCQLAVLHAILEWAVWGEEDPAVILRRRVGLLATGYRPSPTAPSRARRTPIHHERQS